MQLYASIMDNLEEIDRFLEKFKLLRMNWEEVEIMGNYEQASHKHWNQNGDQKSIAPPPKKKVQG